MLYSVFVREYGSPHCVCVCEKECILNENMVGA